jgi:hypothetical protein
MQKSDRQFQVGDRVKARLGAEGKVGRFNQAGTVVEVTDLTEFANGYRIRIKWDTDSAPEGGLVDANLYDLQVLG